MCGQANHLWQPCLVQGGLMLEAISGMTDPLKFYKPKSKSNNYNINLRPVEHYEAKQYHHQ